jgi:anti-sigma factor RsiW
VACRGNRDLLHAYFDGELDAVRSAEFERHLQECPSCAADLRDQQKIRESLRGSKFFDRAPASLRGRIAASLPQPSSAAPAAIPIRRRPAVEWLAVAAAILIVVLLGVRFLPEIAGQQQSKLIAQEILASHIRSLQPGHLYDVQSSDQHTVKPWFDGKLDFAPPVKNLSAEGFPLVGGRLDYLDNRDVAALVYQRQKHFINVFVWPVDSRDSEIRETQTIQGYNLVFWRQNDLIFCAVSDLNLAELRQFAQLLQR